MASWAFALLLLPMIFHGCFANDEGDILLQFKQTLHDPTSATSSWSSSLQNPCTWDHIVCSNDYYVIRIELGSQQLSGSLVSSLGKLSHLEYLELYNNNITGNVPDELGNLSGLISLDLYQNSLTSTIPDSLGRLGKLRYLRLNNNSLHGEIPISLTKISNLQVLDLSNNNLSGSVPSNGSFSRFTPLSFSNNNGLCGEAIGVQCPGQPPLSSPTPRTQNSEDVSSSLPIKAIIAAVVVSAVLVVTGGAVAYYLWRRKSPEDYFDVAYDEEDPKVNLGQLRRFTLRELQLATGNFDNENIIGRGGFGKVYKGQLPDGSIVAVKRLKDEVTESSELQFQMELEIISLAVHRNLLCLTGFCMSVTERLLVYPYMANGSVSSQLREHRERKALTWEIRKRIALGAARGLAYLHEHCDPKIIHRDVKAANILLDDTFEPLVGDFGLAKVIDLKKTHVISAVRGTLGHIAPEYLSTGKTSEKSDVFGYGITLLELVSGQRAYDLARLADDEDIMLLQWVKKLLFAGKINEFVDPVLLEMKANLVEIEEMVQMALLCTRASAEDRPKMKDVVRMQERQEMVSQLWREYQGEEEEVKSLPSSSSMWSNTSSNVIAVDLSGPR